MTSLAERRLQEERKKWRKEHPFGFSAKPRVKEDGSTDLLLWDCLIPGKEGTDWSGGLFKLTLTFSHEYPVTAPRAKFTPSLFHCNVFRSGAVCLDLMNASWKPSITVSQLLLSIQTLLDEPNPRHATDQPECSQLYNSDPIAYKRRIRAQTALHVPKSS